MSSDAEKPDEKDRVTVHTSVAVRGENGFFFGTLRWIEPRRVLVEIDAELVDREGVDVRITLSPTATTALFRGFVGRRLATARGELPRYLLLIHQFMDGEQEKFDAWLRNVRARGTFSNFDTVVSELKSGASGASSDVRQALARLAERPLGSSPPTDPFGARSDIVTSGGAGGGRSAVRDALKSALARRAAGPPGRVVAAAPPTTPGHAAPSTPARPPTDARPEADGRPTRPEPTPSTLSEGRTVRLGDGAPPRQEPTPSTLSEGRTVRLGGGAPPRQEPTPSTLSEGRTVRLGGAPPGAPGGPAPAGAALPPATPSPPPSDPTYATTRAGETTWMEVRWHDAALFERDARLQLCNYILVLARGAEPLPEAEPLRVVLRHGSVLVEAVAKVKAVGPAGATYRLLLDALQLEALRAFITGYGNR